MCVEKAPCALQKPNAPTHLLHMWGQEITFGFPQEDSYFTSQQKMCIKAQQPHAAAQNA